MTASPRLAAAGLLLLTAAAPAAVAADPADLFPASTLAYVELTDPATAGPDLVGLLRGTNLEDVVGFIHGRRDKTTEPRDLLGKDELAVLGLLVAPEMAGEWKRLGGAAAGVTGFNDRGDPRWAAAVLTGESAAAGLIARAVLTMSAVRRVGEAEGVPVFQYRQPVYIYDQAENRQKIQNDKPPAAGDHELTLAYLPGLFVAGTDRATIGELIKRFRGQGGDPLSGTAAFKQAAAAHRKPGGAFAFAAVGPFCDEYAKALKSAGSGAEPDALGWFKVLANPKAVRYAAATVRVRDGGLAVTAAVGFDPAQKSPILTALGGPPVTPDLLHFAPSPAAGALTLALPEKDRAAAAVGLMNALAAATGSIGRSPGEAVEELEKKYQVRVAAELLGRTRAVTVVFPSAPPPPKEGTPPAKDVVTFPTLVLHTDTPEAAAGWEGLLPKLVGDLTKAESPQPAAEQVNGVRVLSLPAAGTPWKAPLHYARAENRIAAGFDRAVVAAALAGTPAASVVGVGKLAFPPGDPAAALLAVSPASFLRAVAEAAKPDGPTPTAVQGPRPVARRVGGPAGGGNPDAKQQEEERKAWAAVAKAADPLPPTGAAVRRVGDELRLEVWQPKVRTGGMVAVINAAVGWFDTRLNRAGNMNNGPMYYR